MSKMATLQGKRVLGLSKKEKKSLLHWCVEVLSPEWRVRSIFFFTWGSTPKCNNFAVG
jgi:hypothetical protein